MRHSPTMEKAYSQQSHSGNAWQYGFANELLIGESRLYIREESMIHLCKFQKPDRTKLEVFWVGWTERWETFSSMTSKSTACPQSSPVPPREPEQEARSERTSQELSRSWMPCFPPWEEACGNRRAYSTAQEGVCSHLCARHILEGTG